MARQKTGVAEDVVGLGRLALLDEAVDEAGVGERDVGLVAVQPRGLDRVSSVGLGPLQIAAAERDLRPEREERPQHLRQHSPVPQLLLELATHAQGARELIGGEQRCEDVALERQPGARHHALTQGRATHGQRRRLAGGSGRPGSGCRGDNKRQGLPAVLVGGAPLQRRDPIGEAGCEPDIEHADADGRRVEQLVELAVRAGQLIANRVECGHRLRHLPGSQQALSQEQRYLDSCARFDHPLQRCREVPGARHRLPGPQLRLAELAQDSRAFLRLGRLCKRTMEIPGGRFEAAVRRRPFGCPPKAADHRTVAVRRGLEQVGRDGLGRRARARKQACGLGMPTCPRARRDARVERGTHQRMDETQRPVMLNEPCLGKRVGRVGRLVIVELCHPRRQRQVGLAADNRERFGERTRAIRQPRQAQHHRPDDAVRCDSGEPVGGRGMGNDSFDREARDQLARQERVARPWRDDRP